MTRRTLRAGALSAVVTLASGRLHSVELPATVPENLEAETLRQLIAELAGFPLDLSDAPEFTRAVWERLMRIPSGTALTYAEIAADLGKPGAVRAVGRACATNRRLLLIPCHRVIAADGIGGFALGLEWKRKLLELEAAA